MGFTPKDFWQFSLREWIYAMEGYYESKNGPAQEPLTRERLTELMKEYPDDRPPS
jgi:hypothetical protein